MKFRWETEFKETEIGKIPKDWEVKELGNGNFKIIMGQSPPSKYYNKEGVGFPFVQGKAEFGELYIKTNTYTTKCAKVAPAFSVLITVRAPVGELNITKEELCIGRGVAAILSKDNDTTKNKFIYYVLKGLKSYIEAFGDRGTTYDSITKDDLENLQIPYPLPEEQTRIATVLSWFDDLIENKRKQNEILEKIAMAIFKSWFIDFEPFQDEEFVYNEELDMEIPKGWEVGELKNIAEIIMGQSPPSKYYNQEGRGLPFIQGKGQFGRYTPHTDTYSTQISKMAKPLDILVTVRAPVGELNIADREYVIGRGVAALRSKFWTFLYAYLKTYNEVLKSFERGTTFDAITKPELESIKILLPPQLILQRFHSLIEPIFQKIINNQKEIIVLKKIRDTLLPQLVFGRLRVEGL